jgi:hypothetical protein
MIPPARLQHLVKSQISSPIPVGKKTREVLLSGRVQLTRLERKLRESESFLLYLSLCHRQRLLRNRSRACPDVSLPARRTARGGRARETGRMTVGGRLDSLSVFSDECF